MNDDLLVYYPSEYLPALAHCFISPHGSSRLNPEQASTLALLVDVAMRRR